MLLLVAEFSTTTHDIGEQDGHLTLGSNIHRLCFVLAFCSAGPCSGGMGLQLVRCSEIDGYSVVAREADRNVRLSLDRIALDLMGAVPPVANRPYCCACKCPVPAEYIDVSHGAIGPDHCLQANLSGEGRIGCNGIAEALRCLRNLHSFHRNRVDGAKRWLGQT